MTVAWPIDGVAHAIRWHATRTGEGRSVSYVPEGHASQHLRAAVGVTGGIRIAHRRLFRRWPQAAA